MNRKVLTLLDVIVIILVVIFSLVIILTSFFSATGNKVLISVDEKVIAEHSLYTNIKKEVKTKYGVNTVEILNGECFVSDSDCRDAICINRGKINKVGESIVCLPHKLIVEIK